MTKDLFKSEKLSNLHQNLQLLLKEDPSLSYMVTEDTEEIVLRGMGAFHLEIAISRLETEHRIKDIFQYPMRIGLVLSLNF